MKNSITTLKKKERPYKRDYTNFEEENLIKDIEKLNMTENILKINDLNKKYVTFHDNVMQVVNKNAPFKQLSNREIKRKKKPWITKGIITSIHKRNSYLKKFRKTDNQLFFIRYKCYRDKISHLIRKSKKDYYCKKFNRCRQNIQKIWQQINKIIHKSKNKDYVTCLKTEKGIISDPFATGNKFNEFYTFVASKLVSKIKKNLLNTNLWT